MKIYGLQKLTLLDFPDRTACTVFTGGCNLRCPFCHNASLVLSPSDEIPLEEFFAFLNKRRGVLDGVCVSGGEPCIQTGLKDFLAQIKDFGFLVKLDTNGFFPHVLKMLVNSKLVDYVAMDLKNDRASYARTVGIDGLDLSPIEESIDYLMSGVVDFEFRTTVTRDFHTKESLVRAAERIRGVRKYYLQKFEDSGELINESVRGYSDEAMKDLLLAVREVIPTAELRGVE